MRRNRFDIDLDHVEDEALGEFERSDNINGVEKG